MNCDNDIFITVEQALIRMTQAIQPRLQVEEIPLEQALGRILAETIRSPINVPAYDNSAMDGYALNLSNAAAQSRFDVVSQILAGKPDDTQLKEGQCARIMTGGKIPQGCDAVVMQENTNIVTDDVIELTTNVAHGANIRRSGDDIRLGDTVLESARSLTPIDIGCLASLGLQTVKVYQKITIGLFTTGDELAQPGAPLLPGQIYDSNRPMLKALLAKAGFNIVDLGAIDDELEKITQALDFLAHRCDAIITCGGVSVGVADYTGQAFASLAEIDFWKVAMKPGKPFAFGRLKKDSRCVYFFGLPGNPVSAAVTYELLAQPMLKYLSGVDQGQRTHLKLPTEQAIKKRPGRKDFQRGVLVKDSNGVPMAVVPFAKQSSGVLSELSQADCLIVLEKERGAVAKGEHVLVMPLTKANL
ncbi:gephyrin-like molybdotransferase Glp [Catenovulum agarivorans]|uniref:molybdopterin molybdotransferase MoeA n=1 Tax=Catenovulum agarivorans TaxID=1172192 RepID=UPI0004BB1705|nr:gephyrin-like molybdotransferase Glp [Catenovulum agarivorans]